jgi:3-deoxy-D-manno-octulosonate 8-phosphate phosphatase (KDO 8-P phosphatase)
MAAIKAIAMDVDGVLTDGTVWLDAEGRETKRIAFVDVMGVSMARRVGLKLALISGEAGPLLDQVAAKLGITDVYGGCKDKAQAMRDFAARHALDQTDVCFIGDDVNDVEALGACGLAVAPAGAHRSAREAAALVTAQPGGSGAVREVIDRLLDDAGRAPAE